MVSRFDTFLCFAYWKIHVLIFHYFRLQNVEAAFDSLADNLVNNLFLNEGKEIYNEKLGSVKVQLTNLKSVVKANSRPNAPSFDPGPALVGRFSGPRKCHGGKTCQGVVLKVVQYKKDLIAVDKERQDNQVDIDHTQVKLYVMLLGRNQFSIDRSPRWNSLLAAALSMMQKLNPTVT